MEKATKKARKVQRLAAVQAEVAAEVNRAPKDLGLGNYFAEVAKAQAIADEQAVSAEEMVVTVDHSAKFNRTGFDALMVGSLKEQVEVEAVEVKQVARKRAALKGRTDGFLGLTRRLYKAGKNGEEIVNANKEARIEAGYNEHWALKRAKSDYGYIIREMKAQKG